MQAIILVHGIMGSKLQLGNEEIWPPSFGEFLSGHYGRIAKLMDPSAIATGILYQYTSFYQIYGPIINDIDAIVAAQGGLRPDFFFDWRVDLLKSADRLAQAIAKACSGANPATEVTLVAHSMGGLVARLVLESGKYNGAKWFKKVKRFVAVCVPQVGAPIAVARALGLEGSTTISPSDMKLIMNDSNFPAGFELFPAPPYRKSVLFDVNNGAWDIYASTMATKFQLSHPNQLAALNSWSKVDLNKRPKGVEYISIAASGLSTQNAFYFNNTAHVATTSVDGDGTVPYWSSSAGPVDKLYTLKGDHIGVMNTNAFRQTFSDIFEARMAIRPYITDRPGVSISLDKRDLQSEERMEVLLIPDARTTGLVGKLLIHKATSAADGKGVDLISVGADIAVAYEGPPIASLPLMINAPQAPGAYVLTFEGTHRSAKETSAAFFVNQDSIATPIAELPKRARKVSKPKKSKKSK
jgi:pimeloyl-ACP methyl ester carboxylesterase